MKLFLHRLAGPRFVDPYIRASVLLLGMVLGAPIQVTEFGAAATILDLVFAALIIASPWWPRVATLSAAVLTSIITIGFAPYGMIINDLAVAVTAGVALSYRYRVTALSAALVLLGLNIYAFAVSLDPSWFAVLTSVGTLLLALTVGWAADSAERRIATLIAQKTAQALEAQRRETELRDQFALDAHDTVSHGLTKENFMLRAVLTKTAAGTELNDDLAEVLLANRTNQQNLRALLAGLGGSKGGSANAALALAGVCDDIRETFYAAKRDIDIHMHAPQLTVCAHWAANTGLLLTELATNVLKHGQVGGARANLAITCPDEQTLRIECTNVPRTGETEPESYSVQLRTKILNGTVAFTRQAQTYRVTVEVPIIRAKAYPTSANTADNFASSRAHSAEVLSVL